MKSFDGTNTEYYTRTPDGQLAGITKNTGGTLVSRYPLFDHLGSVVAQTDSTGASARTFSYSPYGVRSASGSVFDDTLGFAGGAQTTGSLIHFGQRLYDPGAGRWTQLDPIGSDPYSLAGSPAGALTQDYSYAGDDPIDNTDSTGLIGYAPCGLRGERRCPRPSEGIGLEEVPDAIGGCISGGRYGAFYGDLFAAPEGGAAFGCVIGGGLAVEAGTNALDQTQEVPERRR